MPYTFKYLNDPAATDGTVPEGINDSGQVVGHYTGADNNFHGFLYNLSSNTYATLTDPSGTSTFANGINNSGLIVGFYGDFSASGGSSARHAFTYDSSSSSSGTTPPFVSFDDPSALGSTVANGINDSGQIVGAYRYVRLGIDTHGFLVDVRGGYTSLDGPAGATSSSEAVDINNRGQVVGGYLDSGPDSAGPPHAGIHRGFIYDHGSYTTISVPSSAIGTWATGINDLGQVVGYYKDSVNAYRGFIYSGGTYVTIDDPQAQIEYGTGTLVTGINDEGQIVGYGWSLGNQDPHGFILTLPTLITLNAASADYYVPGTTPVVLESGLALDSQLGNTVSGASVVISGGTFAGDGDLLGASTAGTQISASYDSGSETLTLTGNDTLADYQAVLRTVAFSSSSQDPIQAGAHRNRTVSWLISSASAASAPVTMTIDMHRLPGLTVNSLALTGNGVRGEQLPLGNVLQIMDRDNVGFQKLELADSNGTVTGGQFVINGIAQTGGHEIDVAPADVSKTVYNVGTLGGTDTLWARLQQINGALTPWQQFTVTTPLDNAPTVAVANMTATHLQVVAAANLFSTADADGDALTQYAFYNNGTGGGRFLLNGFTQAVNQEIDVSAAQLSHLIYQAGSGTETLWVRVNDGAQWSSWSNAFTVTVPASTAPAADTAPAVSVTSITAFHGESFAAANLFAAHDGENNPIVQYAFADSGTGGGRFVLDGVAQVVNQEIDVTAAQLSHLSYQSGSGADTLWVRANDGTLWSNWSSAFTVTAPPDAPPTVSVANLTATTHGQDFGAESLFTAQDAENDPLTQFAFWNTGAGGARFLLNGHLQPINQEIDVSAAQLPYLGYLSGAGPDTLWVRANDGYQWGPWSNSFTVTGPVDTGPMITPTNASVHSVVNQTFSASSLFSYSDPFGYLAKQYDFWNNGGGGGHFLLNGSALPANQDNIISASQLSQLSYQVGTGTDTLWIKANDGTVWGAWSSSFTMSDPPPAIGAGETLTFGSAFADTVSFLSDTGTLKLDDPSSFAGTVAGLHGQDAIDLAGIGFGTGSTLGYAANADNSGGTLSVGDGVHTVNIALLGSYMASTFAAASDGHGGTLISEAAHASTQTPIVTQPHA
jgi:probable HAF family extracellular repeat protein